MVSRLPCTVGFVDNVDTLCYDPERNTDETLRAVLVRQDTCDSALYLWHRQQAARTVVESNKEEISSTTDPTFEKVQTLNRSLHPQRPEVTDFEGLSSREEATLQLHSSQPHVLEMQPW